MLIALLSWTSTSSGFNVCASMEARHWRSISPPLLPAAEDEARHLVLLREHLAAAVDDVRVFKVDAIARNAHAGVCRRSYSNGYYSWSGPSSAAEHDERDDEDNARHQRREVRPDEARKQPREVSVESRG